MAAGTGNLEWFLPADAYKSIYLSTLHHEDVQHCKRVFPGATVFQYDYLNDDVASVFDDQPLFERASKKPENLTRDLYDPNIKWIIFINPPFATSQKAGHSGESKKSVSDTKIRLLMHEWGLGEVSRELAAQFLFRIRREFADKQAHLGLFYKLKYINSNNDQMFRDKVFQLAFKDGFIFSSANFFGTQSANAFPVGFLVWELRDGEDAFAAEFLALLHAHAGQQAEVVLLERELPAAVTEFAFGAVPVQSEVGRRGTGEQRGHFSEALPHFAGKG